MVALLSSIMVQKKSNQKSSKSGFTGVGCGILFGLPFAAVSVFMAWRLLSMLLLASAASNWIDTPATITHLGLEQGDETQKLLEAINTFTKASVTPTIGSAWTMDLITSANTTGSFTESSKQVLTPINL